jgi:hypothetical protein
MTVAILDQRCLNCVDSRHVAPMAATPAVLAISPQPRLIGPVPFAFVGMRTECFRAAIEAQPSPRWPGPDRRVREASAFPGNCILTGMAFT